MVRKEVIEDELYVYYNHRLIYKKWLWTGIDRVFHEGEGLTQFYRWPYGFVANKSKGEYEMGATYTDNTCSRKIHS